MAGQPRTRAKKAAQAAAASGEKGGSRARAGKPAKPKKAPAKKRPPAKGKGRGPARPRFEPASVEDFAAFDAAMERAAAAVEKKEPLKPAERVARDEGVIAAWALGLRPPTIAERFEMSPSHVRAIIDAHRQRRATVPIPASSELLIDTLEHVEALIERTSLLVSSTEHDAVKVGGIRTLMELLESRAGLWQVMGWVGTRPADDERAKRARDMLRQLLDVLRELGVPQEQIDTAARRVLEPGADDSVTVLEGRARSTA